MDIRGVGDRWLAGETIPGVAFAMHASVEVTSGRFRGQGGAVILLMALASEPLYLVKLNAGAGDVRVRQSELRAVD